MRVLVLSIALAAAGCSDVVPTYATLPLAPVPVTAQQAYFEVFPTGLFFAAAAVCDNPRQTLTRPSVNEVRCSTLPDPESAAALILQFNGTVENLPTFIIQFQGRATNEGYLVTADNYVRVPLRDGGTQQIRFPDPVVQNDLKRLLEAAGGRPL